MEEDVELDQEKLKAALEKVTKHNQSVAVNERKRGYNSIRVRPALPNGTAEP